MTTIEDGRSGVIFQCDAIGCEEEWKPPALGRGSAERSLQECWEDAKEEGWRCFKNDRNQWEHRCPECRGQR